MDQGDNKLGDLGAEGLRSCTKKGGGLGWGTYSGPKVWYLEEDSRVGNLRIFMSNIVLFDSNGAG